MAGGVFISYRREDSDGFAGRIYDRLAVRLGHDNVFFDVDAIPPGRDFVDVLSDRVGKCDALVAVIGKNWVASADNQNRRRLNDPNDFVRIEIEAALSRDVPVIPVLVDGAAMPRAEDLPDSLKKLVRRQAIEVSHNRFDSDAERLTEALAEIEGAASGKASDVGVGAAPQASGASSPAARGGGARLLVPLAVAAIAVAGAAAFLYERPGSQRKETAARTTFDVAIPLEPSAPSNAAASPNEPSKSLNAAATPPNKSLNAAATGKAFDASASPAAPNAAAEPQQWLSRDEFSAEIKQQFANGNYPDKAWGRCENGIPQAGAHWSPQPAGQHFVFFGGEEPAFNARSAELTAQGYTLQYENTFKDCSGRTRRQALWMKAE